MVIRVMPAVAEIRNCAITLHRLVVLIWLDDDDLLFVFVL